MHDHLKSAALAAEMSDDDLARAQAAIVDLSDLTGEQQAVLDEFARRMSRTDDGYHRYLQLAADAQIIAEDAVRNGDDSSLIAEFEQRAASFRNRARAARQQR
ncbi:hypothetical protein GS397_19410 [Sphingobium yanoikuyae]|uniref:Uncharacterized protein n=1 Tax=Sphingobium yanoikuyae TaxID=13690 RepID=A0A6P1GKE6_SPHYA|nr:hypothetical protein [Sphingobium yanoikuyae]QHD69017.1 hypothetical protein GS397_19410 [Sphingobium yanoikuyae]